MERDLAHRPAPTISPCPPQEDYSLAEVFRGRPQATPDSTRRKIGFLAAG
jgi:hypothetical protein